MTAAYDTRRAPGEAQRSEDVRQERTCRHPRDCNAPDCPCLPKEFATAGKLPGKAVKALRRRCGVGT